MNKEETELWISRLEQWLTIAKGHHKAGISKTDPCLIVLDIQSILPKLKRSLR